MTSEIVDLTSFFETGYNCITSTPAVTYIIYGKEYTANSFMGRYGVITIDGVVIHKPDPIVITNQNVR